jgi:protein TonB
MGVAGGAPGGKPGGRLGGHGDDVVDVDRVAVKPEILDAPKPRYPSVARARHQEGVVQVEAVIGRDGMVEEDTLRVVTSQPPFDEAALEAIREWRFRPGRDETGAAVRVRFRLPVRFHLR